MRSVNMDKITGNKHPRFQISRRLGGRRRSILAGCAANTRSRTMGLGSKMSNPRSLEEWADNCAEQEHLIAYGVTAKATGLNLVCGDCAHAYSAQVRQEEREACAKIVEGEWAPESNALAPIYMMRQKIATALRAREP